jgi:hypothetical protein
LIPIHEITKKNKERMIAQVLFAALLSAVATAKDCQYFLSPDIEGFPLGIGHCSYMITGSTKMSMMVTCLSENYVQANMYSESPDCTDTHTSVVYGHSNATFDCSTTKAQCGKAYGYKTPCACTAKDGNCDSAYAISLVDDLCFTSSLSAYYYKWSITCGSLDKAQATLSIYTASDCTGTSSSTTNKAGCQTATSSNVTTEVDYIICPGNMATLSLSLLVGLIAAALAL